LARAATAAYRQASNGTQIFSVDAAGRWVNHHRHGTIVSPKIHTSRYEDYSAWVAENWMWQYEPRRGDTVIDVGAGLGEEAIVFSRLVGASGKVVSIEAHPQTFGCLRSTLSRSGLRNVVPIFCAIADQDGAVTISDDADYLSNSILKSGEAVALRVPARTLDSLADELGLGEVSLLKMNIEGAERLAVRGMANLTKRLRHVVISCHDFISERGGRDNFRTFSEVRSQLEELGFDLKDRREHADPWTRYYLYGRNPTLC
jgi:FkbM family methyltransferase